jgi:Cu+-exporting ATPase
MLSLLFLRHDGFRLCAPAILREDSLMTTRLQVEGMTCQNCARHVREALEAVPGVAAAQVDLEKNRATVRWTGETENTTSLLAALDAAGYPGSVQQAPDEHEGHEHSSWQVGLILGGVVTIALMLGEWGFQLHHETWFRWTSFVLALLVQIFSGAGFYRGAWQQLKRGQSNMDTLVVLGSSAAFGFSVFRLFTAPHEHLYFMEAAAIITLISAGHWLEARVGKKASLAVKELMHLAPETASRLTAAGTEETVPVDQLRIGDFVLLRPGNRVPIDGTVKEGGGAVDESMLTGESRPAEKTVGESLFAGTLNQNGRLVMAVTATGAETALARIIAVVEKAQNSRAQIQRLADTISSIFVPIVVGIALATLLGWGWGTGNWEAGIINAVSVLIVACPCAMGLATPAAIMAGTNAAARRGILIRDGIALEKSGTITAVLFDKTGTLTEGKPRVRKVQAFGEPAQIAALAKALAEPSHHPLSRAVALHFDANKPLAVTGWKEVRGSGVEAILEGRPVRLGSLRWLADMNVRGVPAATSPSATILGLADEGTLLAFFSLEDSLKSGAAETVAKFRDSGLQVHLVSGDQKNVADSIGREAGIPAEHIWAEVRPEAKAGIVERLQKQGERVAFVGDGINDAPALAQADLGIAVTQASDVARESADILLLKNDIAAAPEALGLARQTLRVIRQNLFWAFFYNAAAVPVAALGGMSPILCAAAMGLSDLFVLGNALRLFRSRGTL